MENRGGAKIAIVGTGFVGSAAAYALLMSGLASELVLIDINREKAEGEAMDLSHGASFAQPARIYAGDYSDCRGAEIVIFTAGANQKPGETRLDLVQKNAAVLREAIPQIVAHNPDGILLLVTNPVDIMTYLALRISNLPPERVIGSGTVLDTSRLRYMLSQHFHVDARNAHAYIIGEHGDSELAVWSLANIAGVEIDRFCSLEGTECHNPVWEQLFVEVRDAGYKIIERKGATYYAIGLAVKRICECILRDEYSILTVSGLIDGLYGVEGICLSLPSVVSRGGRIQALEIPLDPSEQEAFCRSARAMREIVKKVWDPKS